ncbi:hypothetical protein HA050_08585 [Iodobacter sp. HSC-16F04]|uniref:Uncharacterized protein n=1 Tax=Iodobacter violaceini TaxID=3044271 RepID=A0ABX0KNV5_9NEIS|nr:hypothetical protein [Iodobacter violacea]NHQ86171.1 hypothetical protein [Iodobacter violacea]
MLIRLGMMFLISKLLPIGSMVALIFSSFFTSHSYNSASGKYIGTLTPILSYLPAFLIAHFFIKHLKANDRITNEISGNKFITTGLAILLFFYVVYFLATTIPGGGPAFAVIQLGGFLVYISQVLIVIGVVAFLLAVEPKKV